MAKIVSRELFWDPSPSQDVVEHRIYYSVGQDAPVNYECPFTTVPGDQHSARAEIVLDGLEEGVFSFGVSVVDDAGNESDIYQHPDWVNVPLDVAPPAPVSGGGIRESLT